VNRRPPTGSFTGMSAATTRPDPPPIEHEHPDVTGGWLRPAVFGAMDGLVSNLALIAGMAGGTVHVGSSSSVVLAGIAGLVGGAFSMATGEYVSVASQSEAAAREVDKERREILRNPAGETAELAEMYAAKGLDPGLAAEVARQIHADVENAVSVHAREELGVDPGDLASPTLAAASSFVSFAVGALVPLLPYLLGATNLLLSMILGAVALLVLGAAVARFTRRSLLIGAVRQLVLGAATVGVVFGVGSAIGSGVGT
jgi:vacuolar iron transporter family protein